MSEKLKKYIEVFRVSYSQEFAYKVNFVMWRVRNIIKFFLVFFIWDVAFQNNTILFGYDKAKMLTYVFGLVFVNALVLSTRATDVAGDISRGDIMNLLVRPVNFFQYWLSRDVASKALNIAFGVVEAGLLYVFLRPPFFFQSSALYLALFIFALILGIAIYFMLAMLTSLIPFWIPEAAWGAHFLVTAIFVQFFSGSLYPLDVFPEIFQRIVLLTPFPYLIYGPLQIYLGQVQGIELVSFILIPIAWTLLLYVVLNKAWQKGLVQYEAHGK